MVGKEVQRDLRKGLQVTYFLFVRHRQSAHLGVQAQQVVLLDPALGDEFEVLVRRATRCRCALGQADVSGQAVTNATDELIRRTGQRPRADQSAKGRAAVMPPGRGARRDGAGGQPWRPGTGALRRWRRSRSDRFLHGALLLPTSSIWASAAR